MWIKQNKLQKIFFLHICSRSHVVKICSATAHANVMSAHSLQTADDWCKVSHGNICVL